MGWESLFFQFLVGHAFADFVLQHEAMAIYKNRNVPIKESPNFPKWYYWLTSHAFIHGGVVFLITGSWIYGCIETVLHWLIDFSKCESWIGFHTDQVLHISCKIGYVFYLVV